MAFKKGYAQTLEQQKKMKESRHIRFGNTICIGCKKEIPKYSEDTTTCGERRCQKKFNKLKYKSLSETDKIAFKALKLFSTIRLGIGKKDKSLKILKEALGTKCSYCETVINLDNASVDHKLPRQGSKVYNRKTKKQIYTDEEIHVLDAEENLQIICRDCNQTKSDMTDEQFRLLIEFLNKHIDIKEKLFHRLKLTRIFFGSWRR